MADRRLTDKQERLVEEYLGCGDFAQAARKAGYSGNPHTLVVTASKTLKKPHVAAFLKQRKAERKDRFEVRAELFFKALFDLAADPSVEPPERRQAAVAALDRIGYSPIARQDLTVREESAAPVEMPALDAALGEAVRNMPPSVLARMGGKLPRNGNGKAKA